MSSHCNRYPGCGCGSYVGTKCALPDNDPMLKQQEETIKRNELGYPLTEDGKVDWEKTSKEKEKVYVDYERHNRTGRSKHAKPTNYTPPKKKRRKK